MTASRPPFGEESIPELASWARAAAEPHASFNVLRDERPVNWQLPLEGTLMEAERDAFWAVMRYEDVVAASNDTRPFRSGKGVMIEEVREDLLEAVQSFLAKDAPRHGALRRLVSLVIAPSQVAESG